MEQIIIAVLDRIENELARCYWNKNQKEISSPFKNTGNTYSNKMFTVRAYNWGEDSCLPNFESKLLKCNWYKHSHRCLNYNLYFDPHSEETSLEQLNDFLCDCIDAIKKDFGEK